MNDINTEIGNRIKQLREQAGITQSDLGATLKVGKAMISKYEAGLAKVSPESLAAISTLFNTSVDALIFGAEQAKPTPTKADALRMVITSDPALIESIKADLRAQVREEGESYKPTRDKYEDRLLKAFRLLDDRRKERLIDTAEDMTVALSRGSGQDQGAGDCAESR